MIQFFIALLGTQLLLDREVLPMHVQFKAALVIKQMQEFSVVLRTKLVTQVEQLLKEKQL